VYRKEFDSRLLRIRRSSMGSVSTVRSEIGDDDAPVEAALFCFGSDSV
jgi:hypothetical protein